ncbi:hypothetical protein BLA60_16540 [Actinophytocola xinjiangensis]|uniref:Uncharacterized protein n=1 Tax=Actinophytocola xinjiangensis TaxID=485602 RepID=A0A7Z0WPQ6_9PSEU|nr:hypothetical protein [Actinophytocola xinjiangensis]OLF10068.1 hypothetical protein BLA60_16540 [Actinophytocola xinjiangensis]
MTEDVTRGLSLLADEAEPAPIDSHAVVALARARTGRRRAVIASASVTLATVAVLALTVTALRSPTVATPAPTTTATETATETVTVTGSPAPDAVNGTQRGPAIGTEVRMPATPEERAARATRLQQELRAAFDRVLPEGWEYSTFKFACDPYGCWARGSIVDDAEPVDLMVHVSGDYSVSQCYGDTCTKKVMPDGTLVALDTAMAEPRSLGVDSVRPDGTSFSIYATWKKDRDGTLTDEQWRALGSAVTY